MEAEQKGETRSKKGETEEGGNKGKQASKQADMNGCICNLSYKILPLFFLPTQNKVSSLGWSPTPYEAKNSR